MGNLRQTKRNGSFQRSFSNLSNRVSSTDAGFHRLRDSSTTRAFIGLP